MFSHFAAVLTVCGAQPIGIAPYPNSPLASGFVRRTRRIARDLAMGFSTSEAAQRHQLSPARISQLRRELHESWRRFHDADSAAEPVA